MTALASMAEAAASAGVHYDTFRKGWATLVATQGFPAPVRSSRPYRWNPASLAAWQARREAENAAALKRLRDAATASDAPANDPHPAPMAVRRLDRDRGDVLALMRGAARAPC